VYKAIDKAEAACIREIIICWESHYPRFSLFADQVGRHNDPLKTALVRPGQWISELKGISVLGVLSEFDATRFPLSGFHIGSK